MRAFPRLGAANLALVSFYFVPVWGTDALRALLSPYNGLDDRVHAAAVLYFRQIFDLGLDGLLRMSQALAGMKLVMAAGFVAFLIEFARSLAIGREMDRGTLDAVLVLAVGTILIWAWPALALDDVGQIRLYATQALLISSAVIVIMTERHIEQSVPAAVARRTPAVHVTSDAADADLSRAA
jgi:hypothetical protein